VSEFRIRLTRSVCVFLGVAGWGCASGADEKERQEAQLHFVDGCLLGRKGESSREVGIPLSYLGMDGAKGPTVQGSRDVVDLYTAGILQNELR